MAGAVNNVTLMYMEGLLEVYIDYSQAKVM
jgi:hypothetical protein